MKKKVSLFAPLDPINIVAVRNMNLYKHIMKYSKLSLLHTHMGI